MRSDAIRFALRWVWRASFVVVAVLLIVAAFLHSFGILRTKLLLSFMGLGLGAVLAGLHVGWLARFRGWAASALGAIVVSQVCFHLLVWTGWATESLLWRVWWASLVPSVTLAHGLAVHAVCDTRRGRIERGTPVTVWLYGAMLLGFALFPKLPPRPGLLYLGVLLVFAGLALAGSVVVWRRSWPPRMPRHGRSRKTVIAWLCVSHVLLLVLGFYVGRTAAPGSGRLQILSSALADLTPEQIDSRVRADLERLRVVSAGLDDLVHKAAALDAELHDKFVDQDREYYLPEEEDRIRRQFMTYLNYRTALLRLVATHAGFEAVDDPALRARCFMVGFAAAMTAYEAGVKLVTNYDGPLTRSKLNEPERKWGIPAGMFDRIYERVTDKGNAELAAEMTAYFESRQDRWHDVGVWSTEDFEWLRTRLGDAVAFVQENSPSQSRAWVKRFMARVKEDTYTPAYAAQSIVAEWIGDTRFARRPPFVNVAQIEALESELRPGDILLERRNWYLSNAFLPGFWPHAALYVGGIEDLRRLGIADEPEVRRHLADYLELAPDGRRHTVIESVSEGVIFNSLTDSMHADYVAALRPRLSEQQIGRAIVRAFRHLGKSYDFEFDFFTSDKLVCTELVYRAYEGMLHFDLVRVMSRDTLPAIELVRKFARERGSPDRELDFVLFLDAVPETGGAQVATEEEFCATVDRPRAFTE